MPSDAKKRAAAKKRERKGKGNRKNADKGADKKAESVVEDHGRNTTGVLASHPNARDLKIDNFSLTFHGEVLFQDTQLELTFGRRYGLIGANGSGKSTLLKAISDRDVEIPEHIDIFHLSGEIDPTDMTALEAVVEADETKKRLEAEVEELIEAGDMENERLDDLYERLDQIDSDTAKPRAARLLHGLGFTPEMQNKATKDFSGGWRMRISLARALFLQPTCLLLDEPTNHLDLEACVWLEEELKNWKRILILVSHSQDFLNNVCTHIMLLQLKELKYYSGNYDQYCKTRAEQDENQMRKYQQEQNQIADMKEYIARFGHGSAKLARQAQSKEKVLAKMVSAGLTKKVETDQRISFRFPDCGDIPPPVMMVQNVSFRYNDDSEYIYKNLEFGIDLDSRLAWVGPNGAGKSTLMKLLVSELHPTDGMIRRNAHLRISRFHQHLEDQLDYELSPLKFMQKEFPDNFKDIELARRQIGRFGLTGKQQVMPIQNLSDGQRVRVIFSWLAMSAPHLLLLDEPTNHLDIETIDSLADAINNFKGGVILISHDFRLISQVAQEIWVCENQTVTKWDGDILGYKTHLREKVMAENGK